MTACFVLLGLIIISVNYQSILIWITSLDTFAKYKYAISYNGSSHRAYYIIYGMLLCSLAVMARRTSKKIKPIAYYLLFIAILAFPINAMEANSETIARMSGYMLVYSIPLFSLVYEKQERIGDMSLEIPVVASCAIFAFFFFYVINGNADVVPYTSTLMGI